MAEIFKTLLVSIAMVGLGLGLTFYSMDTSTDGSYTFWWGLVLLGALGVLLSLIAFLQHLFTGRSFFEDD